MANSVRIGVGVSDQASRPIHDIHDAFLRLQRDGAKGLGIGLGAAAGLAAFDAVGESVHEVTGFLKESVQAAIEEEAGIARLSASLVANVPAWHGNTAAIEAAIKKREELGFSDDSLRDSLASLVGATHDVNAAFGIQSTAMDLARFKGISLEEASSALIKVEGGQYRALKALGIVLKEGATQTDALAAVQAVAAGQAEAFGNTTAGAMKAAEVAVHNLQEEVGARLAPAVKAGADVVTNSLVPALDLAIKGFDRLASGSPEFRSSVHENAIQSDIFAAALGAVGQAITGLPPDTQRWIDAAKAAAEAEAAQQAALEQTSPAILGARDAMDSAAASAYAMSHGTKTAEGESEALTRANIDLSSATIAAQEAMEKAAAIARDYGVKIDYVGTALSSTAGLHQLEHDAALQSAGALGEAKTAAQQLIDELDRMYGIAVSDGDAALYLARGMDAAAIAAQRAAAGIAAFRAGHPTNSAHPGTGDANIAGSFSSGGDQEALSQSNTNFQTRTAAAEEARRKAQQAADDARRKRQQAGDSATRAAKQAASEAERKAKQAEAEHARAVHEQLNAAYDKLKDSAKEAFATIHEGNLKAIQDAHDAANAAIDAQEKAIRGKVSAEQQRINDLRDARRERELRQGVADATTPEDRAAAVQALTDFLDDQRIARLQSDADTNIAALDAQKAANDALEAADKEREDKRYKHQQKALDDELKALKTHLDKYTGNWKAAFAEIAADAKKFGVDKILGIKPEKPTPVHVTPVSTAPGKSFVPTTDAIAGTPGKNLAGVSAMSGTAILVRMEINGRVLGEALAEYNAGDAALRNPTHVSTGSMR